MVVICLKLVLLSEGASFDVIDYSFFFLSNSLPDQSFCGRQSSRSRWKTGSSRSGAGGLKYRPPELKMMRFTHDCNIFSIKKYLVFHGGSQLHLQPLPRSRRMFDKGRVVGIPRNHGEPDVLSELEEILRILLTFCLTT